MKATKTKHTTELIAILDMSGSMYDLAEDTIGGFNALIDDQKKDEEKVNVTLVTFNHAYSKVLDRIPIGEVKKLTSQDYHPNSTTALLDAIGKTITEFPVLDPDSRVIMSITTDGLENSSVEFDRSGIKKMIEDKQKEGWEILFVGANMDAITEAGRLGIHADHAATYTNDRSGVGAVYDALSSTIKGYKKTGTLSEKWAEAIENDNEKRKN